RHADQHGRLERTLLLDVQSGLAERLPRQGRQPKVTNPHRLNRRVESVRPVCQLHRLTRINLRFGFQRSLRRFDEQFLRLLDLPWETAKPRVVPGTAKGTQLRYLIPRQAS